MRQLVMRIDGKGRTIGQYFREEIADPYNIDFYTQNDPRETALREAMYNCIKKNFCIFTVKVWEKKAVSEYR